MKASYLTLRALAFTTIFATSIFISSCEGCHREKTDTDINNNQTLDNSEVSTDTVTNDHAGTGTENTPGSSYRGSGSGRNTTSSGSGTTTTGKNSTPRQSGSTNSTGYGDSNSPIENSSTPAVRNGKPIESSGSSGTGMGTGTGSTGNNSKVTRPEDQRN